MTTPTLRPELQITRDEIVEGEREIEGPVPGHPALRFVAYAWLTPGHKTDFVSRLPESCIREIQVFRGDRRIGREPAEDSWEFLPDEFCPVFEQIDRYALTRSQD